MAATRVMHVITSLHTGGAESMLERLVTAGGQRSTEACVVSLMPGGAVYERLLRAGVPTFDLGMRRARPDPRAVWRLAARLRAVRPDVVQSWMYHADLLAWFGVRLAGRTRGRRLYWGVRCSDMDVAAYGWQLRLVLGLCRRLSPHVDAVVANSFAGRAVHRQLGYSPPAFPVIVNGIDTQRFRPDPDTRAGLRAALGISDAGPVLINVARVDPMKGHRLLLDAVDGLCADAPEAPRLLLVGAGTEALPPQPGVLALGRRDDVPALLAASDLVVSSSLFGEGFSNAIAEGMASALVPVVTDVGDSARMIGEVGRSVPPGDVAALRTALQAECARDATTRVVRGTAARARIEQCFSLARAVSAFDTLHAGGCEALAALTDPEAVG